MQEGYYDYSGELELDKEQRKKFDYIHDKMRHQVGSLTNRISDLSEKLDKLYEAERPDVEKISDLHNKIHDIEREIIELRIKSRNQKYDLLNKEQREIFSRRHHQMHDYDHHHHRGHMNMHHMMR
jgi:Spy/CpxP family protein refolding chaperone